MCHRTWKRLAFSIYHRALRRSGIRPHLLRFPSYNGASNHGNGVLYRKRRKAEHRRSIQEPGAEGKQMAYCRSFCNNRQLHASILLYSNHRMASVLFPLIDRRNVHRAWNGRSEYILPGPSCPSSETVRLGSIRPSDYSRHCSNGT